MKVKVWLPQYTENKESNYSFSPHDMSTYGYTHIGDADVSITLFTEDSIVVAKIHALNMTIKAIQADAEKKIVELKSEISKLQALTCA